jgi:hypothetical protein
MGNKLPPDTRIAAAILVSPPEHIVYCNMQFFVVLKNSIAISLSYNRRMTPTKSIVKFLFITVVRRTFFV